MTELTFRGCTILIVEDEYLLADDLHMELIEREAVVLGPAATLAQGIALVCGTEQLDGAILDVSLRGDPVFPLADALLARKVPFVFTTGYDASIIPERFAHIPRCEKPVHISMVIDAIGRVTHARGQTSHQTTN